MKVPQVTRVLVNRCHSLFTHIDIHVGRPQLDELFTPGTTLPKAERNRLIRLAHGKHGYTLKEISEALGIHYTTVSKVINR